MVEQERAKVELLRAKRALIDDQIADHENFIKVLLKRADQGGDELDMALERKLASMSAAQQPAEQPAEQVNLDTIVAADDQPAPEYTYPKIRTDSIWPYMLRHMAESSASKLDELIEFAKLHNLIKTDSALRSTFSQMKNWGLVNSDNPGHFTLTPKASAFVSSLKPTQFVPGGTAGTTQSENNA